MALPDYYVPTENPLQGFLQGFQGGAGIREIQTKQQAQQLALSQTEQQKQLLSQLASNPNATGDDYAKVITQLPQLAEPLSKAWTAKNSAQQQTVASDLLQVGAALKSNQPQTAIDFLTRRADAMEQSAGAPTPESEAMRAKAQAVGKSPTFVLGLIQASLAANPSGKDAAATLAAFGSEQRAQDQAPADLLKKQADATSAAAKAGAAPQTEALGLAKTAQEIQKSKDDTRIAELNTQIGQANSETSRGQLVLERDKLVQAQQQKTQDQGSATQDAYDSATALLDQIKGVATHPGLNGGTGTMGGINAFFNSSDSNDFRKAVNGLKAPVFLNELSKLKAAGVTLGAVTEAEGAKLESRIANLDVDQSTPQFKNQVGILMKDTEKFINKIVSSGKLPKAGGAYLANVTGVGKVDQGMVNTLLERYPNATQEDVMKFLQSRGKQ